MSVADAHAICMDVMRRVDRKKLKPRAIADKDVICTCDIAPRLAGGNKSDGVRREIIVGYCVGWLKPYENQWRAYPPEIARGFVPELAALVGYAQHRPNLGSFGGQSPSIPFDGYPADPARRGRCAAARSVGAPRRPYCLAARRGVEASWAPAS